MTIGDRLRRERVRAGLTQMEMASACKTHRGHVWKVENGVKRPSLRLVDRWSRVTGSADADLLLEGPPLFDLAFDVDGPEIQDPFAARSVFDKIPPGHRRFVAVWPCTGDAVLRLRARASALPVAIDLADVDVRGIGVLSRPTVSPVRAVGELVAWVRASSEADARAQVDSRLASSDAIGRVTLTAAGRLFVAHVGRLSGDASIRLQSIVEESPIGLYVPATV